MKYLTALIVILAFATTPALAKFLGGVDVSVGVVDYEYGNGDTASADVSETEFYGRFYGESIYLSFARGSADLTNLGYNGIAVNGSGTVDTTLFSLGWRQSDLDYHTGIGEEGRLGIAIIRYDETASSSSITATAWSRDAFFEFAGEQGFGGGFTLGAYSAISLVNFIDNVRSDLYIQKALSKNVLLKLGVGFVGAISDDNTTKTTSVTYNSGLLFNF